MQTHITDDVRQLRPHPATGQRAAWARIYRPLGLSNSPVPCFLFNQIICLALYAGVCCVLFACSHLECMLFD